MTQTRYVETTKVRIFVGEEIIGTVKMLNKYEYAILSQK